MGGWRDRYRALGGGEPVAGIGHNGLRFHYGLGPKVDSSGELADGRKFRDIVQLKQEWLSDPEQLARNLVRQLLVYATGAPVQFADRPQVERILQRSRAGGYGLRSLIEQVVQSEMFLNK